MEIGKKLLIGVVGPKIEYGFEVNGVEEIKRLEEIAKGNIVLGLTGDEYELSIMQKIRFSDLVAISPLKKDESLFGRVMGEEYERIKRRKENPTDSETSQLLKDPEMIRRKLIEEAYELTQALSGNGNIVAESADVLYSNFLALVRQGITLDEVAAEIKKRQG